MIHQSPVPRPRKNSEVSDNVESSDCAYLRFGHGTEEESKPTALLDDIREFLASSVPIMLVDLAKFSITAFTVMKVGRTLDTTALAAASLGNLTVNIVFNMIVMAPLSALDTIAPQTFGSGDNLGLGLAVQRSLLIGAAFLLPMVPLWLNAEHVLVSLGQPVEVSAMATSYILLNLPGLVPLAFFDAGRKFLYAQGCQWPPLVAAVVGVLAHFVWLEIWVNAIGFPGAPLALSCTFCTMFVVQFAILIFWKPHKPDTWAFSMRLWLDAAAWKHALFVSLSSLTAMSEWLFWELVCFRAGELGALALAVYGITYTIEPVCFMIPMGLSTGLANMVGNLLGAGRVAEARKLASLGLWVSHSVVVTYCLLLYVSGAFIPRLFTEDERVLSGVAGCWPWFTISVVASGSFSVTSGLNRGIGLQPQNAIWTLVILWPFGAPLVLYFTNSVVDIWQHLPIVYFSLSFCLRGCAARANWDELAAAIQKQKAASVY